MIIHIALGVIDQLEKDPSLENVSINPFNVLILEDFKVKVIDLYKKDDSLEMYEDINYQGAVKMFLPPAALDEPDTKESQVYSLGCLLYLMIKN